MIPSQKIAEHEDIFLRLFPRLIQIQFRSPSLRRQLTQYLAQTATETNSTQEIIQEAANECWLILLEPPAYVESEWKKAEVLLAGNSDYEAFAWTVAKAVVKAFTNRVTDKCRDKDYAQLRQAIYRIDAFETVKSSSREDAGQISESYAPKGAVSDRAVSPPFREWDDTSMRFLQALRPPSDDIRKLKSCRRDEGEEKILIWNYEAVEKEGLWFWDQYIESCCKGHALFIAVYALYCWLRRYLPALGENSAAFSLDEPVDENDENTQSTKGETMPSISGGSSLLSPEEQASAPDAETVQERLRLQNDLQNAAHEFSTSLPLREAQFLAWYDEEPTLESLARRMGLSSPSSVMRYKNQAVSRMQSRVTQYDDDPLGEFFVHAVQEECKKRVLAPTNGEGGTRQ